MHYIFIVIIHCVIESLILSFIFEQSSLHHYRCRVSVKVQQKDFKSRKLLHSVALTVTFITIEESYE